jgi:phosphoribosylanthranilate isomerase
MTSIQIYTMQSPEEARAVAETGADHIGITPSQTGLPGEIDIATAQAIMATLRGRAIGVALSVATSLDEIVAMVEAVRPDILHLCGPTGAVPPARVAVLRARLPGVPIMQAISVGGAEAIAEARAYQQVADYLILDTQAPDIPGVGASGKTHDWSISRAIVAESHVPVILAGGLAPENVAEAIRTVRPWGVDSLTHTNRALPGGRFQKDLARVGAFVAAAREI